jgi:hypothetical protein
LDQSEVIAARTARLILRDAIDEKGDETSKAALDPWGEGCFCFAATTQVFIEM